VLGYFQAGNLTEWARGLIEMQKDKNKFFINQNCVRFIKYTAYETRVVSYLVIKKNKDSFLACEFGGDKVAGLALL
jgi:hypothetical protein